MHVYGRGEILFSNLDNSKFSLTLKNSRRCLQVQVAEMKETVFSNERKDPGVLKFPSGNELN